MATQGMTMVARAAMAAALALVGGCGSSDDAASSPGSGVVLTGNDGEQVQIGGDVSASLPAGISTYPGAQVASSTVIDTGDGRGVIMAMLTADTPQKVIDFYRAQAVAAGVRIVNQASTDTSHTINGEGAEGMAMTVSAVAAPDGKTIVQLTAGKDG